MTNAELDDAVVAAVRAGSTRFSSIRVELVKAGHNVDYRSVDRALQRLRKAKRLRYAGGWKLAVQP